MTPYVSHLCHSHITDFELISLTPQSLSSSPSLLLTFCKLIFLELSPAHSPSASPATPHSSHLCIWKFNSEMLLSLGGVRHLVGPAQATATSQGGWREN